MEFQHRRRRSLGVLAAAGLSAAGLPQARAQAWPSKQIRIFCGFAPGGTTDPYARVLGDYLSQKVAQPVVVENRPGAGGFISLEALSRVPPDGHTIGITTSSSLWGSRALYRKMPFDADRDFVAISWLPVGPLLFGVPASLPVNSVQEWVDYAKKNPVTMASYNPASVPHLAAEEFNQRYDTKVNVVHYKGEGPMWPDVGTGTVHGGIGSYAALNAHIQRGTIKILASVGSERNPRLPNVKSFVSQGFDGEIFRLDGGLLMVAPAATPPEIVTRLSDIFVEATDSPKSVALREAFAIDARPTTAAVAQKKWREESPIWIAMTERMNIKLD